MKTFKFSLLFVVLSIIYCCSTNQFIDSDREKTTSKGLTFQVSIGDENLTRKVNNTWENEDKIGVYAWSTGKNLSQVTVHPEIYNRPFVSKGGSVFTVLPGTNSIDYPTPDSSLDFIAYYPYSKNKLLEDFIYPINIANQSNIDEIDFLFSNNLTGLNGPSKKPNLVFRHQLAKFRLILNSKDVDLNGVKVVLKNIPTEADFNLVKGTILAKSSSKDVVANVSSSLNEAEANALLIPNTGLGSVTVNIILPNGKTYIWKTPLDWKWDASKVYTKTLNVLKDGSSEPEEPQPLPKVGYFETPLIYKNNLPVNERYVVKLLSDNNPNTPGAKQRNFAYLYDIDHKISYWVAYPMHPYYLAGSVGRNGTWTFDPELDSKFQVNLKSGYIDWFNGMKPSHDRGHQIASGDRQRNAEMNNQTFYSPNVTPQQSGLNQKIWQQLEDRIQGWTKSSKDTIYVVTGAGFTEGKKIEKAPSGKKGANNPKASVPHYYYKVLAQKKGEQYRTIGFFFEHRDYTGDNNIDKYRFSVKEIEDKTGFSFFPGLPDPKVKEQNSMW